MRCDLGFAFAHATDGLCGISNTKTTAIAAIDRVSVRLTNLDDDGPLDIICLLEGAGHTVACPIELAMHDATARPCGVLPAWPERVSSKPGDPVRTLILDDIEYPGTVDMGWFDGDILNSTTTKRVADAAEKPAGTTTDPALQPTPSGCLCATLTPAAALGTMLWLPVLLLRRRS